MVIENRKERKMNRNDFYNAIKKYAESNNLTITIEDSPFTLGPTITFEGPLIGTIRYETNLVENDPYMALKKMFRVVDSRLGRRTSITYDEFFKPKAPKSVPYIPEIKNVIFNEPATIVMWSDGTKTVVKCQEGEGYDPEKGMAMAISKKALGNKGNYCEVFKKWLPEEEKVNDGRVLSNDLLKGIDYFAKAARKLNFEL